MTTVDVEIKTRFKVDEAISRISAKTKAISGCFAYMIATTYGNESQLVGEVNRDRIILARARPLTHNSSKPVLKGVIIADSQGSIIKGGFEYNCFRKYFFWTSTVILGVAEFFILLSIFAPENQPIFSLRNILTVSFLPGLQLIAYLFTRFVKDSLFASDSKWIEDELRKILS